MGSFLGTDSGFKVSEFQGFRVSRFQNPQVSLRMLWLFRNLETLKL
jgi:hypothetical protein